MNATHAQRLLREIANYTQRNRQVGHTRAVIQGLNYTEAPTIYVVGNPKMVAFARRLITNPKVTCICINDLERPAIFQGTQAMVLDHFALEELIQMAFGYRSY